MYEKQNWTRLEYEMIIGWTINIVVECLELVRFFYFMSIVHSNPIRQERESKRERERDGGSSRIAWSCVSIRSSSILNIEVDFMIRIQYDNTTFNLYQSIKIEIKMIIRSLMSCGIKFHRCWEFICPNWCIGNSWLCFLSLTKTSFVWIILNRVKQIRFGMISIMEINLSE